MIWSTKDGEITMKLIKVVKFASELFTAAEPLVTWVSGNMKIEVL